MITMKSSSDFKKMEVAGATVAAALAAVKDAASPGVAIDKLDAIAAEVIRENGCTASFLGYQGYPATICASPNDVIVHGIPDDTQLRDGDVLSIDIGAIYEGFHGDAAITFPIGDIAADAARLVSATREAMWDGVRQVQHGSRIGDIGAVVESIAKRESLGVVRDYVGHGIGRQMHEEPQIPNYGEPGKGMKLRTGMAICIEPMFNLGAGGTSVDDDGWTVRTEDGSVSAHFEHTVAITPDGVRVMTLAEQDVGFVEALAGN